MDPVSLALSIIAAMGAAEALTEAGSETHEDRVRARLAALTFPLPVYRGLALGPNERVRLETDEMTSWTWDRDIADAFASGELGFDGYVGDDFGDSVIIKGIIESPDDVDWNETLELNIRFTDYEDFEESGEKEIVGLVKHIEVDAIW